MTDIKLDDNWQLTSSAGGDAPITSEEEGMLQTIRTESITQEGELFYDEEFGWSLLDYIHAQESDLVKIEIESRIKKKLTKYDEIIKDTVKIAQTWGNDALNITVRFQFNNKTEHELTVSLNRIEVNIV